MKHIFLLICILLFGISYAQVGIGTATPDASSVLDISSTTGGLLIPRMTTGERTAIATPAAGLQIYDTTTNSLWYYNGTSWGETGTATNFYNADGTLAAARTVTMDANTLAFTTNNTLTNAFSVDGTTFSVDALNNRVGIGTTSPNSLLHVAGSITVPGAESNNYLIGPASNATTGVSVKALSNPLNSQSIFAVESSGSATRFGVTQGNGVFARDGFWTGIYDIGEITGTPLVGMHRAGDDMTLFTNDTEKVRILSNGNVGIGTTTPQAILSIGNNEVLITNDTSLLSGLTGGSTESALIQGPRFKHLVVGIRENDANDSFSIVSGGGVGGNTFIDNGNYDALVATFQAGGNVGIRTIPTATLDVNGGTRIRGLSGVGERMVSADANGVLGTSPATTVASTGLNDTTIEKRIFSQNNEFRKHFELIGTPTQRNFYIGQSRRDDNNLDRMFFAFDGGNPTNPDLMVAFGLDGGISTNGAVGVGVDTATSKLHVSNGTNTDDGEVAITLGGSIVNSRQAKIVKDNNGSGSRELGIYASLDNGNADPIRFYTTPINERVTIMDGGNVGIGVTDPDARLQIANQAGTGASFDAFSDYSLLLYQSVTPSGSYGLGIEGGTLAFNSGNTYDFKIGGADEMTLTSSDLNVNTDFSMFGKLALRGSDAWLRLNQDNAFTNGIYSPSFLRIDNAVTFNEGGASVDFRVESNTNTHMLFVDGSTNEVGIGTSNPTATLDINGDLNIKGSNVFFNNGSSTGDYLSYTTQTGLTYHENGVSNGGAGWRLTGAVGAASYIAAPLGLGKTNPAQQLDVNGNVVAANFYAFGGTQYGMGTIPSGLNLFGLNINGINFQTSFGNAMRIAANGNVGIGITSPTSKLHVIGNILASGSITSSDRRLKSNIKDVGDISEKFSKLEPKSYMKKHGLQMDEENFEYGFIAQDFEELFPELVYTYGEEKLKAINYTALIPLLIKQAQIQQNNIATQQRKIDTLEKVIQEMKKRLDQLEK